jgi:hypothetical protein
MVASLTEVLVAAGAIVYSGSFTPTFRAYLLAQWTGHLE